MCIRTIKSIGLKEYASGLWTSIKEIDGGKILSSASSLLEVNVKAIKNKIDALCDENTEFAIRDVQQLPGRAARGALVKSEKRNRP